MKVTGRLTKSLLVPAIVCLAVSLWPGGTVARGEGVDLLQPLPEMPVYRLNPPRGDASRFGRSGIAIDWVRTKPPTANPSVRLSGRHRGNRIDITFGGSINGTSGSETLSQMFGIGAMDDYEFWFEIPGPGGASFLVSNVVSLGRAGPPIQPRPLTDAERADIAEAKLVNTPPESAPDGYAVATEQTPMVAGAMVKAGWRGGWEDAEVVAVKPPTSVTVRFVNLGDRLQVMRGPAWIATDSATRQQMMTNPGSLSPSIDVLPGTIVLVPQDTVRLPQVPNPAPGMPVRYVSGNSLSEGIYLGLERGQAKLKVRFGSRSRETTTAIDTVLVNRDVVSQLNDPAYVARLAEATKMTAAELSELRVKDYRVKDPPPHGHVMLPPGVPLPEGSGLKAFWGHDWSEVTVLADTTEDPVPVRWDKYGAGWDCRIVRQQLAIDSSTLSRYRRTQPSAPTPRSRSRSTLEAPTPEASTPSPFVEAMPEETDPAGYYPWRDASGRHEIEARYVEVDGDRVVLETQDGRTVKIGIRQLSESDRTRAKRFYDAAKTSPFEFE